MTSPIMGRASRGRLAREMVSIGRPDLRLKRSAGHGCIPCQPYRSEIGAFSTKYGFKIADFSTAFHILRVRPLRSFRQKVYANPSARRFAFRLKQNIGAGTAD